VTILRLAALTSALLLPLFGWPAATQAITPAHFADVTVTTDATIKAMPALAADCRREGDRFTAKWRKEAAEAWRTDPYMRERRLRWTVERTYATASVVGPYVSVLRSDYLNTGGAHPNTQMDTILWDGNAGKRISIRPFFTEMADNGPTMTALAKLVRAAVIAEKKARGIPAEMIADPEWLKGIKPQLTAIGPVTLTPSTEAGKSAGLTVHFSPYDVGPYAEGAYVVFVPWQAFKPHLSAAGAAIFAGARPAADMKKYAP